MSARHSAKGFLVAMCVLAVAMTSVILSHEVTHRGTVLTEAGAEGEAAWFTVSETTKIQRGKQVVTYSVAAIAAGERIVVIVDHDADEHAAIELRLATR